MNANYLTSKQISILEKIEKIVTLKEYARICLNAEICPECGDELEREYEYKRKCKCGFYVIDRQVIRR